MKHRCRLLFAFAHAAFGGAALVAAGCVAAPPDVALEASVRLQAFDARGAQAPLDALPRRPHFIVSSARAFADDAELLLLHGPADAALVTDLEALPLRAAHAGRRIESAARAGSRRLELSPVHALPARQVFTLALPSSALGGDGPPYTAALQTAADSGAGAAWLGTIPPAGASGVAPNLGPLLLALDGDANGAEEGIWLEDPAGLSVPARVERWPCTEVDARAATCLGLALSGALQPDTQYRLRSGRALRDAHGAPIESLDAAFTTALADDARAPAFETFACLRDERPLVVGCALVTDRVVRVRIRAGEPARAIVRSGQRRSARLMPDGRGAVELGGFAPEEAFELEIEVFDAAGNAARSQALLRTSPPLDAVTIAEVLADPAGPEPAQEYVELVNFGRTAVLLQGFSLVDGADDRATTVTTAVELAPAARALLVADAFDSASPFGPEPPPGALFVHVGPSLTRSGLANAGESLILRDAAGRRLSATPAFLAADQGRCVQRLEEADPRGDAADDFRVGDCSPGR